ncbi:BgTH12-00693 [Blumeria graminis f. sp. triticale]|uniref:BgTH12-00693 n=1 Tax=Blumeria graminis f. sp. triticale TaxID=1689686 RepID=A0A9W4DNR9_BLUGR|nr:BgTH12-00693 [Blumeria graminis f. sp. triticale]
MLVLLGKESQADIIAGLFYCFQSVLRARLTSSKLFFDIYIHIFKAAINGTMNFFRLSLFRLYCVDMPRFI